MICPATILVFVNTVKSKIEFPKDMKLPKIFIILQEPFTLVIDAKDVNLL